MAFSNFVDSTPVDRFCASQITETNYIPSGYYYIHCSDCSRLKYWQSLVEGFNILIGIIPRPFYSYNFGPGPNALGP